MVLYPTVYKVLCIPSGAGALPSTVYFCLIVRQWGRHLNDNNLSIIHESWNIGWFLLISGTPGTLCLFKIAESQIEYNIKGRAFQVLDTPWSSSYHNHHNHHQIHQVFQFLPLSSFFICFLIFFPHIHVAELWALNFRRPEDSSIPRPMQDLNSFGMPSFCVFSWWIRGKWLRKWRLNSSSRVYFPLPWLWEEGYQVVFIMFFQNVYP